MIHLKTKHVKLNSNSKKLSGREKEVQLLSVIPKISALLTWGARSW